jgi:hypothetical protein
VFGAHFALEFVAGHGAQHSGAAVLGALDFFDFVNEVAHRHMAADTVLNVLLDFLAQRAAAELHSAAQHFVCVNAGTLDHADLRIGAVVEQQGVAGVANAAHVH